MSSVLTFQSMFNISTVVLLLALMVLSGTRAQDCGKAAGGALCGANLCCSKYGYCGVSSEYCGVGCQSQCNSTTNSTTTAVSYGCLYWRYSSVQESYLFGHYKWLTGHHALQCCRRAESVLEAFLGKDPHESELFKQFMKFKHSLEPFLQKTQSMLIFWSVFYNSKCQGWMTKEKCKSIKGSACNSTKLFVPTRGCNGLH